MARWEHVTYPLLSLCQQKVKMSAKALFAVALLGLLALAAAEVRETPVVKSALYAKSLSELHAGNVSSPHK